MRTRACACGLLLLPGCLIVDVSDEYSYQVGASSTSGDFVPDLYDSQRTRRFYLPFLRIDWPAGAHDLVVLTYDQTYVRTDREFELFVLESLEIEFDGEAPVVLVSPEDPVTQRTHEVARGNAVFGDKRNVVFRGAIRRSSFTVKMKGFATRTDGTEVPFSRKVRYRYDRKWNVRTIAEEWAAC